jgi:hypothetical protein
MKNSVLAAVLLCVAAAAPAQNFKPFTELRKLETEKFDIVFPERSRRTAEAVASFADDNYERVSSLLGIAVSGRIPVTITPDTELFNGYLNPVPYPHIVLFDTPMDIEWTTYENALEGLFLHELTHAVSLSSRGPFLDFMHRVFGGWVLPTAFNAPPFMVEGVTVSFESLDGFGRANDPLVQQRIAQAAAEGTFRTPFQVSGVYDRPPNGSAHYEYGGLFSAYLQKRFGMETYARLWQAMGTKVPVSLSFYKHGFYRIFRQVYGVSFGEVWADFAASMVPSSLEDNSANLLVGGQLQCAALVSGGGRLFFADAVKGQVSAFDPATGRTERILKIDAAFADIDVSAEGDRLLVASYRLKGELASATVAEYETATGRPTGRSWKGLYRPRYFRDGVVGLAADLHDNRIVFRSSDGAEAVLLRGDADTLYSAPAPLDHERIAFIVSVKGVRSIVVLDVRTGKTWRLRTDLPDDAERFRYVRDLHSRRGKLYFSYALPGGFYKLAVADGEGIVFSEREISGGIFSPAEASGSIFYRGEFSSWDGILRYPEPEAGLGGTTARIEAVEARFPARPESEPSRPSGPWTETPYSAWPYLNPFRLWLPFPLARTDGDGIRIDGGGIVSYLSDPTDQNTAILVGGYDAFAEAAFVDAVWTSLGLGLPVTVRFSDSLEFDSSDSGEDAYRAVRAAVSANLVRGIGGERVRYGLSLSANALYYAEDPENGGGAYAWPFEPPKYGAGASLTVSSLRRPAWRLFGFGAEAAVQGRFVLPDEDYRIDGELSAAFEPVLPLRLSGYAVYDGAGTDLKGYSLEFGAASFEGMKEYASEAPDDMAWLYGGSAELRLFAAEIQGNFSHLYFNRLFSTAGWRGAAYPDDGDAGFVHSAVLKAGAVLSVLPLAAVPVRFSPYLWFAVKLSNLDDGKDGNDYAFGFNFSMEW